MCVFLVVLFAFACFACQFHEDYIVTHELKEAVVIGE